MPVSARTFMRLPRRRGVRARAGRCDAMRAAAAASRTPRTLGAVFWTFPNDRRIRDLPLLAVAERAGRARSARTVPRCGSSRTCPRRPGHGPLPRRRRRDDRLREGLRRRRRRADPRRVAARARRGGGGLRLPRVLAADAGAADPVPRAASRHAAGRAARRGAWSRPCAGSERRWRPSTRLAAAGGRAAPRAPGRRPPPHRGRRDRPAPGPELRRRGRGARRRLEAAAATARAARGVRARGRCTRQERDLAARRRRAGRPRRRERGRRREADLARRARRLRYRRLVATCPAAAERALGRALLAGYAQRRDAAGAAARCAGTWPRPCSPRNAATAVSRYRPARPRSRLEAVLGRAEEGLA